MGKKFQKNKHGIPVLKSKQVNVIKLDYQPDRQPEYAIEVADTFLYKIQERKCFYCGKEHKLVDLTHDHFYPKWAENTLEGNKVLACENCNSRKGGRYPTIEEEVKFKQIMYTIFLKKGWKK